MGGKEEPRPRKLVASFWHQRELIREKAWLSEDSNSFLNKLQAKILFTCFLTQADFTFRILTFCFYLQAKSKV